MIRSCHLADELDAPRIVPTAFEEPLYFTTDVWRENGYEKRKRTYELMNETNLVSLNHGVWGATRRLRQNYLYYMGGHSIGIWKP